MENVIDQMAMLGTSPLSTKLVLINIFIGLFLSLAIGLHYKYLSNTFSNRTEFPKVITFILLTTVLIISVIKSSLALSLGLVGALSIVRFRTPIKEPEELAYLFLAITAGLGLGANQVKITVFSISLILIVMALLKFKSLNTESRNLLFSVNWSSSKNLLEQITETVKNNSLSSSIRKYDSQSEGSDAIYIVSLQDSNQLFELIKKVKVIDDDIEVHFLDQNNIPQV